VLLPHEMGVSLTTRERQNEYKNVSVAELMTEMNHLNPDIKAIAEKLAGVLRDVRRNVLDRPRRVPRICANINRTYRLKFLFQK
jgi:hypothetical protein